MKSFSISSLKPLVIGRGPVRLEALEVFAEQGMTSMGIVLSRKDAYASPYCLAPELRCLPKQCNVHLVTDYGIGVNGLTRDAVIEQTLNICKAHGYNAVFAGYGFLAEDPVLAERVQAADLVFIGPGPHVSRQAGAKDAAKITAAAAGAAVVPGFNCLLGCAFIMQTLDAQQNLSIWGGTPEHRWQAWQTLLNLAKTNPTAAEKFPFAFSAALTADNWQALVQQAQSLVESKLAQGSVLVADEMIAKTALVCMRDLWQANPGFDIRIKAIHGGGGKGQRVLAPTENLDHVAQALQAIWTEVGAGSLANKNCVLELNIPVIRHWEVQLIGNGDWCLALGGRDCSLQRFEQKLVEFSLTQEQLMAEVAASSVNQCSQDLASLQALEAEAIAFGAAVGLDSVSTYEAIVSMVDGGFDDSSETGLAETALEGVEQTQRHFFMEMNTRLQVEHRVSELVYGLRFESATGEALLVESLIHLMCLLAVYGKALPKPTRYLRTPASLEVRINAMNNALKPAVGGVLQYWSPPQTGEIRDDQGLSRLNPDTGTSMSYAVTGAYDSNLALSLVQGASRSEVIVTMQRTLAAMRIQGQAVETNIPVLLGILGVLRLWPSHRISTNWMLGYLNLAAVMQEHLNEHGFTNLNPHKVIAWSLAESCSQPDSAESNVALLWSGPGGFSQADLNQLQVLADRTGVAAFATGKASAPMPSQAADLILDPPLALDDCVVRAPSGGLYFAQPAPGLPPFIQAGQTVKKGETLCIIEVMKMFNPVLAPIDMLIESLAVDNSTTVKKGDPLLRFQVC